MRDFARRTERRVCRIVFHGVGPAGPCWANFLLVDAGKRVGAAVFPPSAGLILPLLFSRLWGQPEAVSLFGYSLGAVSALRLCRSLIKQQVRVALLYLIDPIVFWGNALRLPSPVDRVFCCRQRNGARLRLLIGHFGRGAQCRAESGLGQASDEEIADHFPDGRPVYHEDMVRYALDYARLPLREALGLDPTHPTRR
ncbi:hypothetical protein MAMC_02229 [Methylacidimicrobium cyclopophantes]|uniref:Uncharacterized protein n=1 Tax=Methylacidimicrobium cyclopophantes TaxID=1041766 RepID=A0A5E6MHC1_9BACT|nr:alpha/beta hydrolase [Methylacidimicrobium cyclopophantes]VVM08515.1 hypothetical protein MAMC_02229 [Methylacidimicrobium cyclopophantes]